jgi:hypothetical protein
VADKLTPLILDALTLAAAEPHGVPLYAGKAEPGLFPAATAGKTAARKAIDDGLIRVVRNDGKPPRELLAATDKGLRMLTETVSPKKVLEDFVRVLEGRTGEVVALATEARRLAESLAGLKLVVETLSRQAATPNLEPDASPTRNGTPMNATLTAPADALTGDEDDLDGAIVARLADWSSSAAAGQDCPLPELYRALSLRAAPPSLGAFHDCVRRLHAARKVYLHPWTGPLYAIPEPSAALLVGHNIAYYASLRN